MISHRAKSKHWEDIERWAEKTDSSSDHCFLELRSRVEDLEFRITELRVSYLRLVNTIANFAPDRGKFFSDLIPDEVEDETENQVYP
jgi:hypothetical protein